MLRARVAGDASFAPHLTFAVYDDVAPATAAARIDALPASPPIPLRFTGIGAFPASGVLHLTPAASAALPALHAALHRAVGAGGRAHFQPGEWTPHCTLATGLDPAALGAGTAALAADFAIFEATLSTLAVIDSPPPLVHWRRTLGGPQ